MYAKKNVDKKIDIKSMTFIQYLNYERSIYLVEGRGEPRRRFIVKLIPLFSDSPQFQSSQQAILRKTFTSSLYYSKPEFYDFRDNCLHLCSKVQPLSLQSLIWIHKKEGKVFSSLLLRDFTVRIFEGIARLKQTQIFPQNLKPSNMFLQIKSVDDKNWVWSEAGLHTIKRNQCYYKINLQSLAKNNSMKIDPFEMEFYSIAIMIIEMITLQSPNDIDKVLRTTGKIEGVENFVKAEEFYGVRLIRIIRLLLQPPKDNSLNKAIQQYKESREEDDNEEPNYEDYQFTDDRLEGFIKDQIIKRMEEKAKDKIKDKSLSARDIFQKMGELDPQFHFAFSGIGQLQELLEYMGIQLQKSELLYIATYFASMSQIRYFRFVQLVFPFKELIECIIVKASDNYDSFKQFFESQTNGKDFWKVEEIKQFLESLEAPFEEKDVVETVKQWTKGSSKTSIKYAEIYAMFKPIIGMSMSLSTIKKPNTGEGFNDGVTLLKTMLQKLQRKLEDDKGQDLITFFRKNDIKENWTVDSKIYKIIKNYTKDKQFDEEMYRKAFLQMEKEGSIEGDMTKQINYIFLIRNLELEEPLKLLRQVITQKINESNRDYFFEKYEKNGKGWTFESLQDFNKDEFLDFEDRELRKLFTEMDSDGSGTIETRELFYKLTNVKEFDYELIIDIIRGKVEKQGIYLFNIFEEVDPRARLVLSNRSELRTILENLGVELSEDHLQQFYNKFSKKGRFEYLALLREFHPKEKLFLSVIRFILTQHYKGSFDKLYQMGLKEGRKKWNIQSLELINEEMILDFRESELKQIWEAFDPNKQGSLTKEEVAQIFNYEFIKTTELTTKAVESIKDLPKRLEEEQKKNAPQNKQTKKADPKENSQETLLLSFKNLGEKQLNSLCLKMINANPDNNGRIFLQECITLLQDNGIQQNKKEIAKLLGSFKQEQARKTSINFIQFFFYLYDQIYKENEENIPKIKAGLVLLVIKQIKKLRSITNSDMFQWCKRKDKMRLSDFEEVIRRLVEVDLYFEDLETIWQYWGEQEYFTEEDFDKLLQTKEYKPKIEKEKSGREKERDPPKFEKKVSNKPKLKLSEENKMSDFVNQDGGADTSYPKRPMSFGEKDPTFRREQSNKNSNSIRESGNADNRNEIQDTPINRFKADSATQRQKELKGQEKKKPSFPGKKPKEQKVELQQFVNPIKDPYKKDEKKITYQKNQLLSKLREEVADNGEQYISELFSKTNIIQSKRLVSCLTIHYQFSEEEALQLVDYIAKFDKIKLDTLKEHLYKGTDSPSKAESKGKSKQKFERNKSGVEKMPITKKQREEGKRIIDPRRQKVNIPLVKESIKLIKTEFCKRFEINELEPYFFSDKETIIRNDFITKCQSVSTTFSSNICEKIFDYLKPDNQDKINVLSFKLGMGVDEPLDQQEEEYLPEELQKELKVVFQKADKDHSGFIEPNEVEQLLSSLGFNENIKEIENYFAKMDQNFDNRISYNEFRRFIEDQILPQVSNFDEDQEQLEETLRNNDIFRSGSLAATTFQAVIERYGVKLTPIEVQILMRTLNPQGTELRITQFITAVRFPTNFEGKAKGVLYKIRLRKKVQLREVQKVFENISSCFVLAYSPSAMEKEILNISSPYRPVLHESGLFYCDLPLRDARKIGQSQQGLVGGELVNSDILVQMALKEVNGVPIPQKLEIKNNIVRRYLNVAFFDLSAELLKHSIWQVQAEFDPELEDVWRFSNSVRSIFIKVAGYEPRKFEKIVLLFELIIAVVEGNRTLQINCGCSTLPLRQLIIPEGKIAKKLKLIAGLPNRSKEIDKTSISKRGGWKNFFGGEIQSDLQIELIHQNKFKEYHRMLAGLPPQVLLGRKALHYLWVYRQTMAESAFDGSNVNPFLSSDLRMIAFRLSLDVPEVFGRVCIWWKDKVQSRVKTLSDAKKVFKVLMQELYLVLHAKQYELIKRCPCKTSLHNKSLNAARGKMISDALQNIEAWLTTGTNSSYKRRKAYSYNYGALQMHEIGLPKEHKVFMESIAKLIVR